MKKYPCKFIKPEYILNKNEYYDQILFSTPDSNNNKVFIRVIGDGKTEYKNLPFKYILREQEECWEGEQY